MKTRITTQVTKVQGKQRRSEYFKIILFYCQFYEANLRDIHETKKFISKQYFDELKLQCQKQFLVYKYF